MAALVALTVAAEALAAEALAAEALAAAARPAAVRAVAVAEAAEPRQAARAVQQMEAPVAAMMVMSAAESTGSPPILVLAAARGEAVAKADERKR